MSKNKKTKVKNKYYTNAGRYKLNIKWILPLFLLMLILSYFGINYVTDLTYENVYNNITELSEQTAAQLNLAITEQKRFIDTMVSSINSGFF